MTNETEKKAKKVTETELWQLRALDAQNGRIAAEIQLLQKQGMEAQSQMQAFIEKLRKKYGDAQVTPDGQLVYERPLPGIAGKPNIPTAPKDEPEEEENEDDDEEE